MPKLLTIQGKSNEIQGNTRKNNGKPQKTPGLTHLRITAGRPEILKLLNPENKQTRKHLGCLILDLWQNSEKLRHFRNNRRKSRKFKEIY